MSELMIRDLSEVKELDEQTMSSTVGGFADTQVNAQVNTANVLFSKGTFIAQNQEASNKIIENPAKYWGGKKHHGYEPNGYGHGFNMSSLG